MKEELVDGLAELIHNEWCVWSQTIAREENISKERLGRWLDYWVPFAELDEEVKEKDRAWARKILEAIEGE